MKCTECTKKDKIITELMKSIERRDELFFELQDLYAQLAAITDDLFAIAKSKQK